MMQYLSTVETALGSIYTPEGREWHSLCLSLCVTLSVSLSPSLCLSVSVCSLFKGPANEHASWRLVADGKRPKLANGSITEQGALSAPSTLERYNIELGSYLEHHLLPCCSK